MPRNGKWTRKIGWILKKTRFGPVLNIKVCYHDDRYSIEVHIRSLIVDNTVSWVRVVNGVDKYVTESMLTKKEEDTASEKPIANARSREKPKVTLTSVPIHVLERKWVDIDRKKFQKPSPECYDMINQFFEEATEHSTTVTSSKNAGGRSSTVLCNGYLKIGYQFWQNGEDRRKYFNIA